MKKICILFLGIFALMLFSVPIALCTQQEVSHAVIDETGTLLPNEKAELEQTLDSLSAKYNTDVSVYLADSMTADNATDEADNIYDENNYGFGDSKDGILFYICLGTRDYAFSTCGEGITIFNSDGLDYMDENTLPYLKDNDFYGAFTVYAEKCGELLQMAADGHPYEAEIDLVYVIIFILLIPLIIAFIMLGVKMSKMKTAVRQASAADYLKHGSTRINVSDDIYLYSHTTRREKPKQSDSDGTHTSASGTTHGGKSGSF